MALTRTDPATEPVSSAEAKTHLRIDAETDNATVTSIIKVATEAVQVFTRRQFTQATFTLYLDSFTPNDTGTIRLPRPPLSSLTTFQYINDDGDLTTVTASDYTTDTDTEPGRLYLAYDQSWPSFRAIRKAIKIVYVAGYSTIPEDVKHAILLLCGDLYERREAQTETVMGTRVQDNPTVERLLWGQRFLGEVDL